jgi:hypothetical protein
MLVALRGGFKGTNRAKSKESFARSLARAAKTRGSE